MKVIRLVASITLMVGLAIVSSVIVHLAVGTVVTKTAQASTALSIGLYITILSIIELVKEKR